MQEININVGEVCEEIGEGCVSAYHVLNFVSMIWNETSPSNIYTTLIERIHSKEETYNTETYQQHLHVNPNQQILYSVRYQKLMMVVEVMPL